MNNVVLGDLSKYRGGDSIKYNGTAVSTFDNASFQSLLGNWEFEVCFKRTSSSGGQFLFAETSSTGGTYGINAYVSGDWSIGDGSLEFFDSSLPTVDGLLINTYYTYKVVKNGVNSKVYLNDVLQSSTDSVSYPSLINNGDVKIIGGKVNGFRFSGEVCDFKYSDPDSSTNSIELSFVFGSATVTDILNGDNLTVGSNTWWKQGVDENYLTPVAYKSSWVIPMEESQNVTYTDATPFYETNDVFWSPYNIDLTYDFKVVQQGAFLAQLRETYKEDEMVVRTQNGADLGAGTAVDATLSNGYVKPSYLQATSDGILKIKFEFDTAFTDVILQSEGSPYPVGTFIEIDVDNSTATMADVTLGYTA